MAQKGEEFKEDGHLDQIRKNLNPKLKVWIPDTIIFNETDLPPMWIYTNEAGEVWRTDNFNSKTIVNKLANFASTNELVAVQKRSAIDAGNIVGNDIKLLTTKELGFTTIS